MNGLNLPFIIDHLPFTIDHLPFKKNMRSRLNSVVVIGLFYLLLDIYTYFGLKSLFHGTGLRIYQVIYFLTSLFVYYSFFKIYQTIQAGNFFRDASYNFYLGIVVTAIVSKLVFIAMLFIQDGGRALVGAGKYVGNLLGISELAEGSTYIPTRRRFMTLAAAGIASIPLATMLYGITKGKYKYTVTKVKVAFKDLPPAFEGFKIAQISDIHAGSLDSIEEVTRGVEMVNAQNPDLILFTGDMVNSSKEEVNPFIPVFKKLQAKYGQYAVLGNHDYYGVPRNGDQRMVQNYWNDFFSKFKEMGFQLLNNQSTRIEKDGEYLQLLGVENWGGGPWFPKEGDLDKSLTNCADDDFCVLMSHDPSHWDAKVLPHKKHIHLTLSGHTHGMQFGINLPNFKWSPVKYRYPRWMGLYKEQGQYLYVNRGFGFLAFPGRVGMWPEITVLELTREA